ncbi:MAG: DUF2179 domain-containing protein [Anaerolineaceae bacterium]|nr:DUF2179 domain-containing protein [Anaerolineaceae bacterium]
MGNFDLYAMVILPLIIFLARIVDVTLGTIRIIMVSRGKRNIAPLLGFCEVFIWIVAISQIMQNVRSIPAFFAYAGGFAAGTYAGLFLEDKLALGTVIVRVILQKGGDDLITLLRAAGFGVTSVNGEGANGPVKLIYTIVKRKDLRQATDLIRQDHPNVFFSVEDIRSTEAGVFPNNQTAFQDIFALRKSK